QAMMKSPGPDDPQVAVTMNNMACAQLANGDAAEAEKFLLRATDIFKKTNYQTHPHALITKNMLAEVYRSQGRLAEAETQARDTLRQLENTLGGADNSRNAVEVSACLVRLASVLKDRVKNKEAEDVARRAVALRERYLEPGHPDTIAAWSLLAGV